MSVCEQWWLHCTISGINRHCWVTCVLCGHAFKMTEQVEQQICIRFCIKLGYSLAKLFGWFRRPQLWATGDWQLLHDNVLAYASRLSCEERWNVFGETSNHPGDSAPLQPRFGTLRLLAFPKTKVIFEKEEISDHQWDSGKYNKAADGNWGPTCASHCASHCVRSQGVYFERDLGVIVLCIMFLVSCIFFNKCLYFSSYMAGYLLDRPHKY